MHGATLVVILGLSFDIAGGITIVTPLLRLVKRNHPNPPDPNSSELGLVDLRHHYREDKKAQRNARIGIGLLIMGFALQALGAWLENPPSF